MALLAYTGMRPEEVLGMRWEHMHLEEGYCEMVRTVTYPNKSYTCVREKGKTEKSVRAIAIPKAAVKILEQASCKKGYVIHGKTCEEPCSLSTYRRMYHDTFRKLGIFNKYSPYDFRATFGTDLCEAGWSTKQVADMMGHSNTKMVEGIYARSRKAGILSKIDMLDQLNAAY